MSDKWLISRIDKEFLQLINKNKNNLIFKNWTDTSQRKIYKWPMGIWKSDIVSHQANTTKGVAIINSSQWQTIKRHISTNIRKCEEPLKLSNIFGESLIIFKKWSGIIKLNIHLSKDPIISLLDIYPTEIKMYVHKKINMSIKYS